LADLYVYAPHLKGAAFAYLHPRPPMRARLPILLVLIVVLALPGRLLTQSGSGADFDGNGVVDFLDFVAFAAAFGSSDPKFDLDGSGTVDFSDFLFFVDDYGKPAAPEPEVEPEKEVTLAIPGGDSLSFVWVPPDTFVMGAPGTEDGRGGDEGPQREVRLTRGFYIAKTEVTQAQWTSVMGTSPWSGEDNVLANPQHPAVFVSWSDCQAMTAALNEALGEAAYDLPTEAEWELACRAGTTTRWSFGDGESVVGDYAWYNTNAWEAAARYAHAVGTKLPNPWGLYDMHGNVSELVADWYSDGYSGPSPVTDPTGPDSGTDRVRRGGSFYSSAEALRSADRAWYSPEARGSLTGIRLVYRKKVVAPNTPPTAEAGRDRRAQVGRRTMLNGAASSDADGDPLTYRWMQLGGPSVALSDTSAAWPIFTPEEAGTHIFALSVNDGKVDSPPDAVFVMVVDSGDPRGEVVVSQLAAEAGKDVYVGFDATGQAQEKDYDENGALYCGDSAAGEAYSVDTKFRAFVEPDLSEIPPGAAVQSATLSLYCDWAETPAEVPVDLYGVSDAWPEESLTWLTAPEEAAGPVASTQVSGDGQWYSWDVTDLVSAWQSGEGNNGVMLRDHDESFEDHGVKRFASSEDTSAAHRPRLNVVYVPAGDSLAVQRYDGLAGYGVSRRMLLDSRGLAGSRTGYGLSLPLVVDGRKGRTGWNDSEVFSVDLR